MQDWDGRMVSYFMVQIALNIKRWLHILFVEVAGGGMVPCDQVSILGECDDSGADGNKVNDAHISIYYKFKLVLNAKYARIL